ncbi:MAG TPA: methyltransferase domain-containing protein [Stellaceae bacterium]|nr:methyltransferase domain-containing protein [Stellaceae bacterium]
MNEAQNPFTDGQGYERLMGRWTQPVGRQFLDWLGLPQGLRWLDVGCGNGAFTEVLLARCAPAAVSAIDPSEGQLAYARVRPGAKAAEFRQGDAQALPYPDASFDAVTMALAITFVPDAAKAVREMARVARPGGMVATYMWDLEGGGMPLEPLFASMRAVGVPLALPQGLAAARLDRLRELWQSAGLEAVETRVFRATVRFADFDDFWDSNTLQVGPAGKSIAQQPPATVARLKSHARDIVPRQADGSITYEAWANAVKGRTRG